MPKLFKEIMLITLICRSEDESVIKERMKYFDREYKVRYVSITHDENRRTPKILVEFVPNKLSPLKLSAAIFFVLYMLFQIGITLWK